MSRSAPRGQMARSGWCWAGCWRSAAAWRWRSGTWRRCRRGRGRTAGRWAESLPRRRAAGIPGDLEFATKPDLAAGQLQRLIAAGLPVRWVAADEVYARSGKLRKACQKAGLASVFIIPCDFQVIIAAGTVIRADQAIADAVFERRSCGDGSKGPGTATGR